VLLSIAAWPPADSWLSGCTAAAARFATKVAQRVMEVRRLEGWRGLNQNVRRKLVDTRRAIVVRLVNSRLGHYVRLIDAVIRHVVYIARVEGWHGIKQLIRRKLAKRARKAVSVQAPTEPQRVVAPVVTPVPLAVAPVPPVVTPVRPVERIESMAARASAQPFKRVILTDLKRPELVQAYLAADLFVFASQIEYSPLVLYEAAAAGTPFLTVPVGNAPEIVRWTGAGLLCEATQDSRGYTRVDPRNLAKAMARCMNDRAMLSCLGATGRERWRKHFTWQVVAGYYEDILSGKNPDVRITDLQSPDRQTQSEHALSSVA
jgi:glycosyltransferase involved in cell wall biosynthesis